MTKKVSTPALRFKGFTYTWKQRKLSDQFSDFIVPMRDKPKKFGGNIPWTRIEDIEGKYLNGSLSGQFVSKDTIKQMNLKIIPKDSLIVSSSATFGVVAIITQDLITNQTFIGLVPNDKETLDFWYTFFHSNEARNYMRLQSAGSTIFYIAREHFEKMPIIIPFKDEMITIGKYFSNLDRLITLHQRKYDKLTNMKKSMLEKMFPKNGANVPEIRFKGFTDAWKQRKAKDLCSISTGKSNTQDRVDDGIYPFYVRSPIVEHSSRYLFDEEAVLTVGDGVGTGKVFHYVNGKYDLHQRVYRMFDFSEEITAKYFYYYFSNHFYDRVMAMTAKTSVDSVRYEMIADMDIALPKVQEQMAISDYFDRLDNLITLHQRELEKLKNLKKACLEKMFV